MATRLVTAVTKKGAYQVKHFPSEVVMSESLECENIC